MGNCLQVMFVFAEVWIVLKLNGILSVAKGGIIIRHYRLDGDSEFLENKGIAVTKV